MTNDKHIAKEILLKAAEIVRNGWCQKAAARNQAGQAIFSLAPLIVNSTSKERELSPFSFDISSAMLRAASGQKIPRGTKKEDAKLLYWSLDKSKERGLVLARKQFCITAKTMHPSIWNDQICKSSEEAAIMLELAAETLNGV